MSLHSKKGREKHGLFIAEGRKTVEDLLRFGMSCDMLVVAEDSGFPETHHIPILSCTTEEYRKISLLDTPPGYMGVFHIQSFLSAGQLPLGQWVLYTDGINDPGNLGTIIRTCHWFGVKHVVIGRGTASPYNPKTVQSTMGSLAAVSFYTAAPADILSLGLPIYTADMQGNPTDTMHGAIPGVIVMGSESHGISPSWYSDAADIVSIFIRPADAYHRPESLNVSVAAAIILQTLTSV